MIAVVDYHKGNLKSVERGLVAAGAEVLVTSDPAAIAKADAIVLPGVGAFADAAATMRELGQMDAIRERIAAGVPFLGICLGMHLLFEEGVEGAPEEDDEASTNNAPGLAVLPGVVTKMPTQDEHNLSYKVPHVGWNTVQLVGDEPKGEAMSTKRVPQRSEDCLSDWALPGYIAPSGPFVVGETTHSVTFPSAVQYGEAAYGVQFHPEKSSDAGARLLQNFVSIVKGA